MCFVFDFDLIVGWLFVLVLDFWLCYGLLFAWFGWFADYLVC